MLVVRFVTGGLTQLLVLHTGAYCVRKMCLRHLGYLLCISYRLYMYALFCGIDLIYLCYYRPMVSMDVFDHSGRVTAGAIEDVAGSILQSTPTQIAKVVKKMTYLIMLIQIQ